LNITNGFTTPSKTFVSKANPNPWPQTPALSNLPKGTFAIPRVGATLLVQFFEGNINFPVYIGALPDSYQFSKVFTAAGVNNPDSQTSNLNA
jgi:hypothetical protein